MNRGVFAATLAVVFLVVGAVGSGSAGNVFHLELEGSIPEADQILDRAPEKIVLDFSQRPELAVSRITVAGEHGAGKLSDVGRDPEDETVLWATFEEPLADGTYSVSWLTSSGDGHPVRGEFSFSVRAGGNRMSAPFAGHEDGQ